MNTCDICQRVKIKRHLSYDELRSLSRLTNSWKEITMNFITDLSSSKWKQVVYDSILVIVDHYMKMTRYLSTKKTLTVIKLAELFFEKIALRYETSSDIVIDRDSLFISAFWSKICYHVKVKRWLSIAFHLQTDDQTERQNQTLKHYLRVYCFEKQDDWATLLLIVEFVYHQTKLNWSLSRVFISTFWFNLITRYQSSDSTWYWFRVRIRFEFSTRLVKQLKMTSNVKIYYFWIYYIIIFERLSCNKRIYFSSHCLHYLVALSIKYIVWCLILIRHTNCQDL